MTIIPAVAECGHRGLARELLAATPQILRQPWELHRPDEFPPATSPERTLLDLVRRCLDGEQDAVDEAQRLVSLEPLPANPVQDAAVWHALLATGLSMRPPFDALLGDITKVSAAPYPLFDELLSRFPPKDTFKVSLDVLSCQHILGSALPEFVAIRNLLPRAHFWEIIGKPYSANLLAIRSLEEHGFSFNKESAALPERGDGPGFYELGSFAAWHRKIVESSVRRFFNTMPQRLRTSESPILVIDDGGVLINAVGRMAELYQTARPIICIEQTQRGLYAAHPIAESKSPPIGGFAVVNVAQSLAKLALESGLIAESVIENLRAWIHHVESFYGTVVGQESGPRFGVVGFGSVGESIAKQLSTLGVRVSIFDSNRNKVAAAKRQGYNVKLSAAELLKNSDVLIGATGGSWLRKSDLIHLPNEVILAAASSGDAEFEALSSGKPEQLSILDASIEIPDFDRVHGEIRSEIPKGHAHLVNGGFPVNFNGSLDPIRPEKIQLTRALMLAAVLNVIGFEGDDSPSLVGATGVFYLSEVLDRFLEDSYSACAAQLAMADR